MVLYSISLSLVMQLYLFSSRFTSLEYVQKYSNLLHKLGNYTSWTHSRIDYKHTFSCGKFVFDRFNFLAVSERLLTFSQHFFSQIYSFFSHVFLFAINKLRIFLSPSCLSIFWACSVLSTSECWAYKTNHLNTDFICFLFNFKRI